MTPLATFRARGHVDEIRSVPGVRMGQQVAKLEVFDDTTNRRTEVAVIYKDVADLPRLGSVVHITVEVMS